MPAYTSVYSGACFPTRVWRTVKATFEITPAIDIIILNGIESCSVAGHVLWIACLKHKRQCVVELLWLKRSITGFFKARVVRTVRQHHVMQAHAARYKTFFFGIVLSVYQTHKLAHDIAMVPGRAKCIFRYQPWSDSVCHTI